MLDLWIGVERAVKYVQIPSSNTSCRDCSNLTTLHILRAAGAIYTYMQPDHFWVDRNFPQVNYVYPPFNCIPDNETPTSAPLLFRFIFVMPTVWRSRRETATYETDMESGRRSHKRLTKEGKSNIMLVR